MEPTSPTTNPTITLKHPIEHDGKTYASLTFGEAALGHLIEADEADVGEMRRMAMVMASVTGVPLVALMKLKASDLAVIIDQAGALLGNDVGGDGETSPS